MRKVTQRPYGSVSLSGAVFRIEGTGFTGKTYTSERNGVFYVGTLTYGVYYFQEVTAPAGFEEANEGKWFCVIVDELGSHVSGAGYKGGNAAAQALALADAQAVQKQVADAVVTI